MSLTVNNEVQMREYNIIKKMKTQWDGINNKVFTIEKSDFKPLIIKNLRRKFER